MTQTISIPEARAMYVLQPPTYPIATTAGTSPYAVKLTPERDVFDDLADAFGKLAVAMRAWKDTL